MFSSIHKALFPFDNSKTDETEPLMLEQNAIRKEISDLSAKVNALCSMNENLEKEIKSTASSIAQSSVPTTQSTTAAWSVIDEISNRSRKNNLIMLKELIYQLIKNHLFLCSTVFDLNVEVDKVLRLGRRLEEKHRPLLVRLTSECDKYAVLFQAPHLRFHDQYKRVFISQSERVKHKSLVQKLKSRRAKGERNLMIRNGSIIVRYTRVVSKKSGSSNPLWLHIVPDIPSTFNKPVPRSSGAGHHKTLNLMLINIQSVLSKKESFFESINNHQDLDIILECETWLNQSILNSEILPTSYSVYRNDHDDGYGGVLIGTKSNLRVTITRHPSSLEICIVSVYLLITNKLLLLVHIGHLAQKLCTLIICVILLLKLLQNIQMLSSIVLEISTYRT